MKLEKFTFPMSVNSCRRREWKRSQSREERKRAVVEEEEEREGEEERWPEGYKERGTSIRNL